MLKVHQVDFLGELREFGDRSRVLKNWRWRIKRRDVEELPFLVPNKPVLLQHPSAGANRQPAINRLSARILARPPENVRFAPIGFRRGAICERDMSHV